MKKRELNTYLSTQIEGLSPEKQLEELDKIIEATKAFRSKTKNKIEKKYIYCYTRKKYHLAKSYTIEERDANSTVCVFTDAGYGDGDEYANCIYHITERICPKCKERKEIKSIMTWRGTSFTRDGRKGCF